MLLFCPIKPSVLSTALENSTFLLTQHSRFGIKHVFSFSLWPKSLDYSVLFSPTPKKRSYNWLKEISKKLIEWGFLLKLLFWKELILTVTFFSQTSCFKALLRSFIICDSCSDFFCWFGRIYTCLFFKNFSVIQILLLSLIYISYMKFFYKTVDCILYVSYKIWTH